MDINLNPKQLSRGLSKFLHRYHVILFVLIVFGGLAFATFRLYSTATAPVTISESPSLSSFDQPTIDKINSLRAVDEAQPALNLPAGRTNPFQ